MLYGLPETSRGPADVCLADLWSPLLKSKAKNCKGRVPGIVWDKTQAIKRHDPDLKMIGTCAMEQLGQPGFRGIIYRCHLRRGLDPDSRVVKLYISVDSCYLAHRKYFSGG